jgi:hypothetical protein
MDEEPTSKQLFIKSVVDIVRIRSDEETNPINLYIELVSGLYSSMQEMYLRDCTRPTIYELEVELERFLIETTPTLIESLDRLYIPNADLAN